MLDLTLSFEDMKNKIGFTNYIVDLVLSPSQSPEYFFFAKHPLFSLDISQLSNKSTGYFHSKLSNERKTVFGECQYNSLMHGNGWNPELPIALKIAKGVNGYAVQIEDCGAGFDISSKLKLRSEGKDYFIQGGCGLDSILNPSIDSFTVSFNSKGNIVNILYLGGFEN